MRSRIVAAALAFGIAVAFAPQVHAVSVNLNIDPDGAGGANGTSTVATLDWAPGNALIQNIESGTSQVYAHSTLATFGGAVPPVTGLNTTFEWTYILGVQTSTVQAGGILTLLTTIPGGDNFFTIFYDNTPDAQDQTAGTGFDDGIPILTGTVRAGGTNTFTATSLIPGSLCPTAAGQAPAANGSCGPLDQFGANETAPIETVGGSGGGTVFIDVTFADPNFFKSAPSTLVLSYTTQQNLPFLTVDPSLLFDTNNGAGTTPGATVGSIGTCNGCTGETAPNVMVQLDASSAFDAQVVSQPATLMLLGSVLGLASLARAIRFRRK